MYKKPRGSIGGIVAKFSFGFEIEDKLERAVGSASTYTYVDEIFLFNSFC